MPRDLCVAALTRKPLSRHLGRILHSRRRLLQADVGLKVKAIVGYYRTERAIGEKPFVQR